jgi:hypothetical protein
MSLFLPRSLVLATLLVAMTISGRGERGDFNPRILGPFVVVGRGHRRLPACFATANAHRLRLDGVRWRSLVTEKCPNDHDRFKPNLTTVVPP